MFASLKELVHYRTLVLHMVLLDLKVRYRGSVLGFFWTLLNPLLLMLVMWTVFQRFGRVNQKSYALFMLVALMTWNFFSQSIERSLSTFISNRTLLEKIYVPKLIFPFSIVTSNLVNLFFFLIAYLVIAGFDIGLSITGLLIVPVLVMLFILSTGAALLMSVVNVFFRDFSHLTSVFLRALFYLTPIFYPPEMLGPRIAPWLQLNPAYYPVVLGRSVLYYGEVGSPHLWANGFLAATIVFFVGLIVFITTQDKLSYYS